MKCIFSLRKRMPYGVLALITIPLGMCSRAEAVRMPEWEAGYVGDVLWAVLVYWMMRFLFVESKRRLAVIAAWAFAVGIEVSQLYQADWINAIRETTPGGLVLGSGFKWSDIVCYTLGIAMAAALDRMLKD